MKIKAIRLAEVGPFGGGVALEGLSGRLDVLAGANETGKSTLFRALALLIGEKHTSTARAVQALRPNSGGAPLVEAELDIDGRPWRLSKRFLAQRSAELEDLASGSIWRGPDAEEKAAQLLHGGGRDGLRGFVWVAQAESFALPERDGAINSALAALIEQEAATASGAGRARRVRAAVDADLGLLVTLKTGRPRAGGPLAEAIDRRQSIAARLEAARARAAAAERRIAEMEQLRAEQTGVAPSAIAAAEAELAAARNALAAAESAREKKRTADAQVEAAQGNRTAAAADLARLESAIAARETAATEQARLSEQMAALTPRLAAALEARAAAEHVHAGLVVELSGARRLLAQRDDADRRAAAAREAETLRQRLAGARRSAEAIAALDARLAAETVTSAAVADVRRLAAESEVLSARIAASAPRIEIAYAPGGAGRIRARGRALGDGESLVAEGRLELVIDGVGTIAIEPPATGGAELVSAREANRTRVAEMLAGMGAASLAEAEARLVARTEAERDKTDAAAQLRAYAPRGPDELETALSDTALRAAGNAVPDLPERAEIDQRLATLDARIAVAASNLAGAVETARTLADERTRLEAEAGALQRRAAELAAALPPVQDVTLARDRLGSALAAAEQALGEAVRERSAWSQAVPDPEDHRRLIERAAAADLKVKGLNARRQEIERGIAERAGALQRDGEDGTGAEIALLDEQLAAADARLADLELDARALSVLASRLDVALATQRDLILRPVLDRLQPLLHQLHANARVALEGPLLVASLDRGEGAHALQQLSDGTREQIAVLVRLAYAGLMAERGAGLPVVLDDALAFSDDQRFAAMLRILSDASSRHQVIMLSCRKGALASLERDLGGTLLSLAPWTPREQNRPRAAKEPARRVGSR